jgi:hydroxyethylthiazole kinase-like uncharacterized protein yjeF
VRPVLTTAEMRAVDELAQREAPLSKLIGRAGTAVATEALDMLRQSCGRSAYGRRVVVVAGPGNNGADGKVAARLLGSRGARVDVVDVRSAPHVLRGADLVIDAAFGTGFRGDYHRSVTARPDTPWLAVDVPTGLDADLGLAGEGAVSAARTVTFGALKPGLLLGRGPELSGELFVRRLGLPVDGGACGIHLVEDDDVAALVPPRRRNEHKWSAAVMVVAGSPGMYGAPGFVTRAAARGGSGMVRLGVPGAEAETLPASEAVARALPAVGFEADVLAEIDRFAALVVGPGLGTSKDTVAAVRHLVGTARLPTLVDADGLTALGPAQEAAGVISARRGAASVVLTPHDGEFARLAGRPPGRDRVADVRSLSAELGAVVLLKGPTTVVAEPGGRVLLAASGSPALATAGTGDVLSGVIGALLARGVPPIEAAAVGAHVHGRAACLGHLEGLVAGDLPDLVARVLSEAAARRDAPRRGIGPICAPRDATAGTGARRGRSGRSGAHG